MLDSTDAGVGVHNSSTSRIPCGLLSPPQGHPGLRKARLSVSSAEIKNLQRPSNSAREDIEHASAIPRGDILVVLQSISELTRRWRAKD